MKKTFFKIGIILILIAGYALWELYTTVRFNLPSGQYAVGTRGMEITDSSRLESALPDSNHFRRLIVQIWYPAGKTAGYQTAKYHPYPDLFLADVQELFPEIPQVLLKRLAHSKTHSLLNAPIAAAEKNYPVIIFSHGMDGMRFLNTYQMEELASHGYIIVSIEHSFSATGTIFQDGSRGGITPYERMENENFGNAMVARWTADQMFTINQLEKINRDPVNVFYQKLNLDELGIFGFSFGGAVSTNTLVFDKRIKAGVNLDGFYYGANYAKGFQQPFMELRSEPVSPEKVTDAELKMSHLSRERWKWIWFDEWNKRLRAYTQGSHADHYSFTIHGADHFSFCDLPLMAPFPWILSPKTARIHELTNQYTLAFFDEKLKGTKSPLLFVHHKLLK